MAKNLFVGWLGIAFWFVLITNVSAHRSHHAHSHRLTRDNNKGSHPQLELRVLGNHVEMDNGIVKLTLTSPQGLIAGLSYEGVNNILDWRNRETYRGYWDIQWERPDIRVGHFDTLRCTRFRVISNTEEQIEVSFTLKGNVDNGDFSLPLNIDKRYVMLRGVSGFYSYAIFEHKQGWPDLKVVDARLTFKLDRKMFNYMAISDNMQKIMPSDNDRKGGHSLDYKEAVQLPNNTTSPTLNGEVDDKYQFSFDNKDNHVHGWISSDPHIGFWVITPSDEFRGGGPVKTDLTSHAGPTALAVFFSDHYVGPQFGVILRDGEPWKKVWGPIFMYVNSDSSHNHTNLWEDAKQQTSIETAKWPYDFPLSKDYIHKDRRGTVSGRLLVRDRYISRHLIPARSAYVGLAPPGDVGSWQDDLKGYQYWTRTDESGYFTIRNVRPDTYNLYAWVPGIMGDFKHQNDVVVAQGEQIQIGNLVYDPPRNGRTVWEIGIPDRTAAEFYVPDPAPGLMTKLYFNHNHTEHKEKHRQYGLWDRYTDLYPSEDLIYTVGESNYTKDWFYAHVNRKISKQNYTATTWQIRFDLRNVISTDLYTLRIALASANFAEIQVRVNNPYAIRPVFTTRGIGRDNAIARHGIHGRYLSFSVEIPGSKLHNGRNTIYLRQARGSNRFSGVMYDYLRFEGPHHAFDFS